MFSFMAAEPAAMVVEEIQFLPKEKVVEAEAPVRLIYFRLKVLLAEQA
jgi:hypothetical protein